VKLRPLLLGSVLLLAGGCAYGIVQGNRVNPGRADKIRAGVERIHGLRFKAPTPLIVADEASVRAFLRQSLEREYPGRQLENQARAYAALGLLPEGFDLRRAYLDLFAEQGAGFYDPYTRKLVLSNRKLTRGLLIPFVQFVLRRDLVHELLISHELTHALQDQAVDLRAHINDVRGDDDRVMAYRALVEGAATLVAIAYVTRREEGVPPVPKNLRRKLEKGAAKTGPAYRSSPLFLRESLLSPYAEGTPLTREALKRGGWPGIVRAYGAPPLSTEQLLHPEKYFAGTDPPLAFAWPDIPVDGRWRLLDDNVLGELFLGVLFRTVLGEDGSSEAAKGWGGDRYRVYDRGRGLEPAVLWALAFDSESLAARFAGTYGKVLEAKARESRPPARPLLRSATRSRWRGKDGGFWIERRRARVAILENVPEHAASGWIEALLGTPVTPKKPQPLTTASGRSSATRRASPAPSTTPTTSPTSL
jgi:hypothetical protein